ncbi:TRAP transporter substrate-binding protein [Virgibacillus byunsanensis]|uniref:TRAP transporter substrate-binding protein n=1 Tax=Virgibacillus byunsanensis TaxID=570945 RepID=A0ABW3LJC9_9BACI
MVKMSWFKLFGIIGLILLFVVGCGSSDEAGGEGDGESVSEPDSETIKVAYNLPEEHAVGLFFETMADKIEEYTADTSISLEVQTFPNGQLYTDADTPDAISMGNAHIGQLNSGFIAGDKAAPLRVLDLPFLFESWDHVWAAEDGEYGRLFAQHLEEFDMKVLGWPAYGTVELFGNFPIQVPEDIQGKKMRAFGQGASLMLEEMGASPVSMSSQEIYQAVEHNTIDGFTTGPSSVVDRSLHEVSTHGSDLGLSFLSFQAVANIEWFNNLPEDVQDAVQKAADEAEEVNRETVFESEQKYKDELAELGVELYQATDEELELWREGASSRYESYRENAGEDGEEFLNAVEEAKQ